MSTVPMDATEGEATESFGAGVGAGLLVGGDMAEEGVVGEAGK